MLAHAHTDTSLQRLRGELARLRRRRAIARLGTASVMAGLIITGGMVSAFALDYLFDLPPVQRAVMLVGITLLCCWMLTSLVGGWFHRKETETDIALEVERQHGLAGNVVAALQFLSEEAPEWGSPRLEQAVILQVDEKTRSLNLLEGFSWKPLPARALILCAGLAVVASGIAAAPNYASAFLQRLGLANVPYPTKTAVASLSINGVPVDLQSEQPLKAPAGTALVFVATAKGEQPDQGLILLEGDSGGKTTVTLQPDETGGFRGTLEQFTEPVTFFAKLGDGRTLPRRIKPVPRPTLSLDLKPMPPDYARANAPPVPPPGVRTTSVLEGSSVELVAHAGNKPLGRVSIEFESKDHADSSTAGVSLTPSADRKTWSLDPAGTPLANIVQTTSFKVIAEDDEGLTPAEPLTGTIRIRTDRPPRVAAGAVVKRVLPDGRPELTYAATDDFGVKSMDAKVTVTRPDGTRDETMLPLPIKHETDMEAGGRHALDLGSLSLNKGDRVVVTVEAEDARGDRPGARSAAEPLTFEITDREGLLAGLLEADEDGADRLDAIIRRELGIGGQR